MVATKQQTSRRLMPVPEELEKLIELVNSLPLGYSADEIEKETKRIVESGLKVSEWRGDVLLLHEPEGDRRLTHTEVKINLFLAFATVFPQILKDFIGPIRPETAMSLVYESLYDFDDIPKEDTLAAAYNRYSFLFDARAVLEEIAKLSTKDEQLSIPLPEPRHKEADALITIQANSEGKLKFHQSPLLQMLCKALDGVDGKRIGQCPICNKIFWRGRKDQPACWRACSHALRNRKYRSQYQEQYKQQRYAKAEALEAMRKATHPPSRKKQSRNLKGK